MCQHYLADVALKPPDRGIESKREIHASFLSSTQDSGKWNLGSVELLVEEFKSRSLNHSTNQTSVANSAFNSDGPFTYINTIIMAGHDLASFTNNLITLNKWIDIAMAERKFSTHTINELEEELQRGIIDFIQGDARYSTSIFFVHTSSSPCVFSHRPSGSTRRCPSTDHQRHSKYATVNGIGYHYNRHCSKSDDRRR